MPAIAQTPILGTALRKARAALEGGDAPKRLADGLAKMQQLRDRLAQIEREREHYRLRFTRHVAECKTRFEKTKTFEDELALAHAEVVRDWHNKRVSDPSAHLKALYGAI